MTAYHLKIVTPDGVFFDGQAESITLRTQMGEIGILAGHAELIAPLGMGRATVQIDGQKRHAACIGGMVSVSRGDVTVVATTFEWAEDIDLARAKRSEEQARAVLENKSAKSKDDIALAEARLKRALVRIGVKE